MTISSVLNRTSQIGNGATTTIPINFPFRSAADLVVLDVVIATDVQTTLTLTTNYTVTGTPDALGYYSSGGNVEMVVAPAATKRTVVYRDPARTQTLDLVENDSLPAENLEAQIDYVTMLLQRVSDLIGRSLRQPDGDSASIGTLPSKVDRASKFQAYNATGDPIAAAGTSANLGPVSSFIDTLLDDANAAAARTTLGITTTSNLDTDFRILGSVDNTKQYALEVDALTTATTRTRFIANEDANSAQSWEVQNLSLVATVSANALTVALKTKNGTDPSATDPIIFKFRNATIATGDYTTVALTAALSLVVSSGSTLGTVNGVYHRLYVGICNDGGTLRIFIYNPLIAASLSLAGILDDLVYSSTAEGGAGAADTAQVLYSGTAFTNKAIRVLGYVESTQATAGTWATAVWKIQLMGLGVKRTGDLMQSPYVSSGAVATGTTVIPVDDTIPQNTEGDQYLTLTMTPSSQMNLLRVRAVVNISSSAAVRMIAAVFRDAGLNAVVTGQVEQATALRMSQVVLAKTVQAINATATTFNVRAGGGSAATTTINGESSARTFGGTCESSMTIDEIFV